MPRKCCVPGCKSNSGTFWKDGSNQHVTTFSFPKDKSRLIQWIRAIPRKDWIPSKSAGVCCKHFVESDIINFDKHLQPDGSLKPLLLSHPRLKETAVPSIFPKLSSYLCDKKVQNRTYPKKRRDNKKRHDNEFKILPQAYDETELGQFVFVAVKENSITDQCDLFINEANEVLDVTQMMSEHNYCIPHNVVSDIIQKMGQPKNNDAEILRQKLCGRKIIRRTKRKKESVDVNDTTTTVDIEIVKKF